jgi:thiamine pyrophosphate-dependent acetolactate synthase large subunit-like protein
MALGELETAARLGLPMVVLAYNDDAYGAEVHHFEDEGLSLKIVRFPPTDIAAIARATGAAGVAVRSVDDLSAVADWLDGTRDRPLVVDVKVNPTVVGAWLPEAFRA